MTDDSIHAVCDAFLHGQSALGDGITSRDGYLRLTLRGIWLYCMLNGEIIKWRELDKWMSVPTLAFKEADRLVMRTVVEYMDTILYEHESLEELPYLGVHICTIQISRQAPTCCP